MPRLARSYWFVVSQSQGREVCLASPLLLESFTDLGSEFRTESEMLEHSDSKLDEGIGVFDEVKHLVCELAGVYKLDRCDHLPDVNVPPTQ